jgi:exodeoxyribonuclease V alpha subunit
VPAADKAGEASDFYCLQAETQEDVFAKLIQVVTERIPKRFGFDPVNDIQILTPMNRSGLGARSLNVELQARLNGHSEPKITNVNQRRIFASQQRQDFQLKITV